VLQRAPKSPLSALWHLNQYRGQKMLDFKQNGPPS
jgi:hypothetical protein